MGRDRAEGNPQTAEIRVARHRSAPPPPDRTSPIRGRGWLAVGSAAEADVTGALAASAALINNVAQAQQPIDARSTSARIQLGANDKQIASMDDSMNTQRGCVG